ncbi:MULTISPECIES: hypothetical protein [Fictibacillus]|uniref:Uncharacterized protein n=1 Tax=Fictibacillus enclensis TaxID=1017270 RepID=A0A0V8J514_9BACL|nr:MULTISPECIES: hypothetical protein [Fictibacillus]KSU81776.1 hypothetical protein AS030_15920 [Fictibacillus enclensis]RXZ01205.1 hypothetical protein DMO16_17045 [Fictibacillus sp. S7]SCC25920.1 hypothetical protein GA0061096_3356 [Fictibacillus enclensis]
MESMYLLAIILFTVNVMFQKAVALMVTRVEQAVLVNEQKFKLTGLLAKMVKKKERPFLTKINVFARERRNVQWVDTS